MKKQLCALVLLVVSGCAGHRYDPNKFWFGMTCPPVIQAEERFNVHLFFHGPIPQHPVEMMVFLDGEPMASSRGALVSREMDVKMSISAIYYLSLKGLRRGVMDYDTPDPAVMPPIEGETDDINIRLEISIRPAVPHPETGFLVGSGKVMARAARTARLECRFCLYD